MEWKSYPYDSHALSFHVLFLFHKAPNLEKLRVYRWDNSNKNIEHPKLDTNVVNTQPSWYV